MGLLLIPRTPVRGTEPGHCLPKIIDRAHEEWRKKAQNRQKGNPKRLRETDTPERHNALRRWRSEKRGLVFPEFRVFRGQPMSDKLTEIMAWKRQEIAPRLRVVSEGELARANATLPRPPSFANALRRADGRLAVISEIKRRSPSAGDIKAGASAVEQAMRYQSAGADAVSVLTDSKYFGGSLDDLRGVAAHFAGVPPARPCLRKDFMVHPLQVLEAREAGASAILIIVRALNDEEIRVLFGAAKAAGLDALFEIHAETELERALGHGAKIIGVNNRDLAIFKCDLGLSERLIPRFPKDVTAISESGIFTAADAHRVRACGAHAVLVGEALMKSPDPAALIADFRHV